MKEKRLTYEAKFYAECEYKPFTRTKHKCLRCQECVFSQYKWCLENEKMRKQIDEFKSKISGESK